MATASNHPTDATAPDADWRSALGRVGLTSRGVLYLAFGYLAFQAAIGPGSGEQVSSGGVFRFLRGLPAGPLMLGVLALGLAAYAVWQLSRAVFGDPVTDDDGPTRAMYALKGVAYGTVAASAVGALLGSSGGGSGGNERAAGVLLRLPGGAVLTGALGIAVAAYGIKQIKQNGLDAEFMRRLSPDRYADERLVRRAGRAGYTARGLTLVAIGGFFVVAALQHDPDEARGLGGALATLAQQSYGPWLLGAAALGLSLFGVYAIAEARMRRDHGD